MLRKIKQQMRLIWRQRRMSAFIELMHLKKGVKIIDLGGTPQWWEMLDIDLDVTLLNLRPIQNWWKEPLKHNYQFVVGDACDVTDFADNEFDVVFSNSVIEHVGPFEQQEAFARTVQRLAPSYWIQTPSIWFPIEAHCDLPLWWFYPQPVKLVWMRRWQQHKPNYWNMMTDTRVLKLSHLKSLFPEAQVYTEYVAGFPKSYSMYKLK